MAENVNALILPIGADVTQFQKSINDVKDRIKELSSTIKATPFNLVTQGQRDELAGLINTLDRLNNSVQQTSAQFDKSVGSTKGARTALTSLSLVAQDAPFGFIAIQNNLPAVISSFGELSKSAGGLKGALSQIGSALVGPAGLFLAFSAVTGAVTFAIQKYGSLGAAFDALTGNTNEFTEAIRKADKSLSEYNKNARNNIELRNDAIGSVEDEIIKVNTLADVLRSSTSSERQKQGALAELKKANDEYFGKLNAQKIDIDLLNESIGKYTESLIKNKVAQNLASEAAGVFTEFLKQNQLAVDITQQINKLSEQYPNLTKRVKDYFDAQERIVKQGGTGFGPTGEVKRFIELNDQLKAVNVNVKSTANAYGTLKTQADAAFKAASEFLDLGKNGNGVGIKAKDILKLDTQELDAAFNLKDIKSRINEYGNILLNVNNTEKQRSNALKELIAINPAFANTLSLNKSRLEENKLAIEDNIRSLNVLIQQREFDKRATEVNNQFLKEQEKQRERNIQAEEKEADAIISLAMANDKLTSSGKQVFLTNGEFFKQIADGVEVIEMLKKALNLEDAYNKALENLVNFGEFQRKEIDKIVKDLRFLQEPLEGLFTTFFDGASADWKSFADDVIKQIKRVTAALLAKSLIQGLANIFAPGAGSLISGGLKGISDAGLLDFLGSGGVKNPSFGGVSGGPLQMAGAVNLSLRGSDLVGSINRTNATINRVG